MDTSVERNLLGRSARISRCKLGRLLDYLSQFPSRSFICLFKDRLRGMLIRCRVKGVNGIGMALFQCFPVHFRPEIDLC